MYKLLIADDESLTRKGLRDYVNWSRFGITVCGVADDGTTALQLAEELKPDIVLTDVKMPTMDGIRLSMELRARLKHVKILFISGHNDIEYVKSALQLNAVDYILKPLNFAELDKVMERVVELIREDERQRDMMDRMNTKLLQSMPLLKEKFLMTLIRDGGGEAAALDEKLKLLDITLPAEGRYIVAVVRIDDSADKLSPMPEREKQLLAFAVINICQEVIDSNMEGYVFENRSGEYVCLLRLASSEADDRLYGMFSDMKLTLGKLLKISVTIGIGHTAEVLGELPESYYAASQAANHKLFLGKNQIITLDSLQAHSGTTFRLTGQDLELCASLLKAGDHEKTAALISGLFAQLSEYRNASLRYCQNTAMQLMLTGSGLLFELKLHDDSWSARELDFSDRLFRLETVDDMKRLLLDYFKLICNLIHTKRDNHSGLVVEQVKQYVGKHFHSDLTINDIAAHIYLTSTYVCLLFKQETGETINEYVTKVRMEKAIGMLADLKYKLYDISSAVGYSDSSYFSKIFKKHTGLTPSEFRGKYQ
ncbi:response regulator [Paenibacillus thalictri]|uniref:Response regulator n=1 Tax=Paenibacillus thalictri TaxID=2527873 RepID=A0A4Q9DI23_9BACL|nr:response regulator [Paenibacillus thalictri]TBL70726.1 response regulator [Paenibacillus thalictri]